MQDEIVAKLMRGLRKDEPSPSGRRLAAVSIILRDKPILSTLLIRRAVRHGDPWSGQVAFPGGKWSPEDGTAKDTAVRETKEEVGVDLDVDADFLGYASPTTTHTGTMDVVPAAFILKRGIEVRPNKEVTSYHWVGLESILAPGARTTYRLTFKGRVVEMPAFLAEDYVVWGLTHRILSNVLGMGHLEGFPG
jgi:8-oxo-dGTP pyrophosphatase MutT (NUDIX family)